MSDPRHILVCGEIGAGKTALLRRLLAHSALPPGGFVTKRTPLPDGSGDYGVFLHPANQPQERWTCTSENLVGICSPGRRRFCPQVFDRLGVPLLEAPDGGLLLMDELGFMESEAAAFQAAVLDALSGDTPVLAAVKARSTPFLEQVRHHPNARLYTVTPANRDSLYAHLLPRVLAWNGQR